MPASTGSRAKSISRSVAVMWTSISGCRVWKSRRRGISQVEASEGSTLMVSTPED